MRPGIHSTSALALAILLAGCGGLGVSTLGGDSGATNSAARGKGSATLKVKWPARTRLIPNAANSLVVALSLNGVIVSTQTIARPTGTSNTTSTTFNGLAYGNYTASVLAYPTTTGSGVAQASGSGAMPVGDGVPGNVTVDLTSTVAALAISPSSPQLKLGASANLTASATDSLGNIVLLSAGGGTESIVWTSDNPSAVRVTGTSPAATLLGMGAGTANVKATMKVADSGNTVSATIPVQVTVVPGGLAFGGYPKSRGDIGNSGRGGGSGARGNVAWSTSIGSAAINSVIVGPNGTVYASSGSNVSALSSSGSVMWSQTVAGTVSGLLLTADGKLYVGATIFTAFDAVTGNVNWTFTPSGTCFPPNVGADGTLYLATTSNTYAINPVTHSALWSVASLAVSPGVVVANDGTLLENRSFPGMSLAFLSSATGTIQHSIGPSVSTLSSVCTVDGAVYFEEDVSKTSQSVTTTTENMESLTTAAVTNRTKKVSNTSVTRGGGIGFSPGGSVVRSKPTNPSLLGFNSNSVGGTAWADNFIAPGGPSFGSDGTGYAATAASPGTVVSFNPESGILGWTVTLTSAGSGVAPAIGPDGTVYAGTADGQVVAIR